MTHGLGLVLAVILVIAVIAVLWKDHGGNAHAYQHTFQAALVIAVLFFAGYEARVNGLLNYVPNMPWQHQAASRMQSPAQNAQAPAQPNGHYSRQADRARLDRMVHDIQWVRK